MKVTAASRARIARHLVTIGALYDGDPDWLIRQVVDAFIRGRASRLADRTTVQTVVDGTIVATSRRVTL